MATRKQVRILAMRMLVLGSMKELVLNGYEEAGANFGNEDAGAR